MSVNESKYGYIGLGNMGAPMAKRLVNWPGGLIVFDVRAEAMAPFVEAGATAAGGVADVAAADIISVTVLNDEQVRDVVGELATLAGPAPSSPSTPPSAMPRPSSSRNSSAPKAFT